MRTTILLTIVIAILSCTNRRDRSAVFPEQKLEVRDGWARPASAGLTGGAYLTVLNGTGKADTLVGVTTDEAATAEIHESYQEDGISGMRQAGKLSVEPGSHLELEPGGYHIMLMQLKKDLSEGDSLSLILHFARHDSLIVRVPVLQR